MRAEPPIPLRVVIITLDRHLAQVVGQAEAELRREMPGLSIGLHAAAEWGGDAAALAAAKADIACADILIVTMLFMDEHLRAILPALAARREACDALVVAMSAGEAIRLTKLGPFRMDAPQKGPLALLKKLRGRSDSKSSGEGQMAMLRRLPKLLRFIPGKAQDVRAYFLTLQYWLSGSQANVAAMIRNLIDRYADGPRRPLRGTLRVAPPAEYPDLGLYHPGLPGRIAERLAALPRRAEARGTVGLIVLRSYVLSGDTGHYDGVIAAFEAQGLDVVPVFASGLDARPAIARFFQGPEGRRIDALVSLTGFSLVGGPAYNDAQAAAETLGALDVPYVAAQPVEFQPLERWAASPTGLMPVEATMMVAIPELDGATAPHVYGGRSEGSGAPCPGCARSCRFEAGVPAMQVCRERAEMLAERVARLIALRRTPRAERRLAIVLFNFPPNAGATGSAAFLSVFASLHATLAALKADGYAVAVPESVDALREALVAGNAALFGMDANVHRRIPVEDHVRREPHLAALEAQWGPAPGRQLTDGRHLFVLGAQFGNVFVGLQPPSGAEGDPMRLLFAAGFAPTHAFSAFYRFVREDFGAHAVLHFGTHGALEFMPGKQVGMGGACWPDRLIGAVPHYYLYAANNPSEGAIARRRAGATLISYLTPPVREAGLYRGLADLKASLTRFRGLAPDAGERADLLALIAAQAEALDLLPEADALTQAPEGAIARLSATLYETERTLIPDGLHVLGGAPDRAARIGLLAAMAEARGIAALPETVLAALADGEDAIAAARRAGLDAAAVAANLGALSASARALAANGELQALLHALDGGYVAPGPGGDLLRTPELLPTGRNIHGFDPFRIPSAYAVADGAKAAARLLARHRADTGTLPQTVAMVLWGTDNLKSEGGPIAQALALMGARPRLDAYGRVAGAELVPLAELGRPRIDVVMTLSGIFRDLLPLQIQMLAEAALLAATAEEPHAENFIAAHAAEQMRTLGCDVQTAALRVFSNAEGAYGANVNQMIDAGCWSDGDELADAFEARKSFAYGVTGTPMRASAMLSRILAGVDLAYQSLDSVELGVTTIDHYVDTLGGIARAAKRARGAAVPVYVGDQTQGPGRVRSLSEQVALETRTRTLNPRWFEGLLRHGYEGVRQIEAQVTNTMGWSATAGAVEPWVYQKITETYVLDAAMRTRLAALNPKASARMASRLIEAHERKFWAPDATTLAALRAAGDEFEDRIEGLPVAAE